MNKKQVVRKNALLPNGVPRYIRCYDNGGKTADRYTVVFTGRYRHKTGQSFWYVGMSGNPFHPLGIGHHGEHNRQIDRPTYAHLGKKIKWSDLTPECQKCVLDTYCDLWDIV
jgi:hypothetical protein